MPHHHCLGFTQCLYQPHHIAHQVQQGVLRNVGWRVCAAIASHVRRYCLVTGGGKRCELVPPRIPRLWPAVTKEHQRACAFDGDTQADAIDEVGFKVGFGHGGFRR